MSVWVSLLEKKCFKEIKTKQINEHSEHTINGLDDWMYILRNKENTLSLLAGPRAKLYWQLHILHSFHSQ